MSSEISTFHHEKKFNHLFLTGIVILIILFGTMLAWALHYKPGSGQPWRIGITNWPGFDYLYLAQQKGFFKENGLNLVLIPINSINDIRNTYERGQIDGYTGSIMDVVESVQQSNVPSRIMLVSDYSNGADHLLSDPSITTIAGLKGKRVGVEIISPRSRYMLERALEGSGITQNDITIAPGNQTILTDLARHKALDSIITYEPFSSQVQATHPMQVLFDSSRIPREIVDVIAVSPEMEKQVPDLSKRLQQAWQGAMDYTTAHPAEVHAIFAQRYGMSVSQYENISKDVSIFDIASMQRLANSDSLYNTIARISAMAPASQNLTQAEISRTVAIWYQKESE